MLKDNKPNSDEIISELHRYAASWSENRIEALEKHWDLNDRAPLYVAEEIDQPMLNWPSIRAYWTNNIQQHSRIELLLREVVIKPTSDDLVLALGGLDWTIAFRAGASRALGGDNRVLAALRKLPAGWRLYAWVEAPLSPITYMRRLYERRVPPGFADGDLQA